MTATVTPLRALGTCRHCGESIAWSTQHNQWHSIAAQPAEHYLNECIGSATGHWHAEPLLCRFPGCGEPIDPHVWPTHPSHDITAQEWDTLDRADQAALARNDAKQEAALRAELNTSRGRRRTNKSSKGKRTS